MSQITIKADDGGLANTVGSWAEEKHERVRRYVGITRAVRSKFIGQGKAGATYIEPYCAYGRAKIRNTDQFIDGSSIAAWKECLKHGSTFTDVFVGDLNGEAVDQCAARLHHLNAPVTAFTGKAEDTIEDICKRLNPYGLHFAFLDPYNLEALPFSILSRLCKFKRMDILIHVSIMDLQRNLPKFISGELHGLDTFAPGWRSQISQLATQDANRRKIFEYWLSSIEKEGKTLAGGVELVTGSKKQNLYWLVLVASNPRAGELWDKIRTITPQKELF